MSVTSLTDKNILTTFCMHTNCPVINQNDENLKCSNENTFI